MLSTIIQDLNDSSPGVFELSEQWVSILIGLVIPVALGFVLRDSAPNWVKVVLGLAVTTFAVLIKEAVQDDGSAILSGEFLVQFAMIYIPQIAAYYGIWKPLDINRITGPGFVGPTALPAVNRTESTAKTP